MAGSATNTSLTFGQGVNKDLLASELAPGTWSDMLNFRPRVGFEEKFEGVIVKDATSPISDDGGAFLFPFTPYSGSLSAVYGSSSHVYAFDGTHHKLDPWVPVQSVSSTTCMNTAAPYPIQIVTSAPHRLTTGDTVTVSGYTPSGYNSLASAAVTVINATTFQYNGTAANVSNPVTVAGTYTVNSSVNTAITNAGTYPMAGSLNGVMFVYSPADGLFYWSGNTANRMSQASFGPTGATSCRSFKNYLFLLTETAVQWTNAATPGAFPTTLTAGAGNDAGQVSLAETPGSLVDSMPLGDLLVIYKNDSRYAAQYIGGNSVFSFTRLPGEDGLYKPWCVVNTPKGHVFLTQNLDIKIHQGGEATSIAEGRVRKWLSSTFDIANKPTRVFLCVNPQKYEVWVCFATASSVKGCDRALVWNWEADAWGIFDLSGPVGGSGSLGNAAGVSFASEGVWPSSLTSQSRMFVLDADFHFKMVDSAATSGLTGTLERTGMDFGTRDVLKSIDRSRWNINSAANQTATISHGAAASAAATPTYQSSATYTVGTTDWLNSRGPQGRFDAVKLTTTSDVFAVRTADLDVVTGGKR